jgi:hypothetical protein
MMMRSFFKKISHAQHAAHRELEFTRLKERQERETLRQLEMLQIVDDERLTGRKRGFGTIEEVGFDSPNYQTSTVLIRDLLPYTTNAIELARTQIDLLCDPDNDDDDDDDDHFYQSSKKKWLLRPDCWRVAAEEFRKGSSVSTICNTFPEMCKDSLGHKAGEECIRMRLRRWEKDIAEELRSGTKKEISQGGRVPVYGTAIDQQLLTQVTNRITAGLTIDSEILRMLLLELLGQHHKLGLLKENGGENSFRTAWASRFFNRHNLRTRIATTKMRECPADFAAKLERYIDILSVTKVKYGILSPKLVVGMDETSAQLVSVAKRTRAIKGAKRVRSIGIGNEKPAVTVTIACNADGDVLETQIIFQGTTKRCHAKVNPPSGCYFTHTKSHWQTPDTFVEWVETVILPYKKKALQDLELPANHYMILILDLHYSHKDEDKSLKILSDNNIVPIFIPAGCTDQIKVLDVCCNKPFKVAIKKAFRDYVHLKFTEFVDANAGRPEQFVVPLNALAIKPQLPAFVAKGIAALKTPQMKATIVECFKKEGCLTIASSPERVNAATTALSGEG